MGAATNGLPFRGFNAFAAARWSRLAGFSAGGLAD
jgi:hypothetical protein